MAQCIGGASGIIEAVGRLSMPLLFAFLTLIFVVIGVAAAMHSAG